MGRAGAAALLAPWPEPVHTVHWPTSWLEKAWYVGGISRFDDRSRPATRTAATLGESRTVLVLWGGGGRSTGPEALAEARAATPGWDWIERDPVTTPSPDLWTELAEADVVVTHAGQNAVAEVAAARRPAVVIAQTRPFGEQEATAEAVNRLDTAIGLSGWPDASEWPVLLERALTLGGGGWERWSSGDGARRAGRHLETLVCNTAVGVT